MALRAVFYNNKVYISGGCSGLTRFNDLWELDLVGYAWKELRTSGVPPSIRNSHTCVVVNEKLFVFGGYDGARCNDAYEMPFGERTRRSLCRFHTILRYIEVETVIVLWSSAVPE
jgi:hypothetical protein